MSKLNHLVVELNLLDECKVYTEVHYLSIEQVF